MSGDETVERRFLEEGDHCPTCNGAWPTVTCPQCGGRVTLHSDPPYYRSTQEAQINDDDRKEVVERYASWLENLCTATYGFRTRAQQKQLREAAQLLRKLGLKARYVDRVPFCPDHRDKVAGKPCRECKIERLKQRIAKDQQP